MIRRLQSSDNLIRYGLLTVVVAIPLLLFAGASWVSYRDIARDSRESVQRTAATMHEHALKVFDTVELLLELVDSQTRHLNWDQIDAAETSAFLAALRARYSQVVSIWITDAEGYVRAGSSAWDRSLHLRGRDFFDAQKERDAGTFIGRQFVGRATQTRSVGVSRRRAAADGFNGTVHVALSPAYFEQFYAAMGPEGGFTASLIRQDGEMLARFPVPSQPVRLDPQKSPLMQRWAAGLDEGIFAATSPVDGIERLGAFRKVHPYPVYVFVALDNPVYMAHWYQSVTLNGVVTLMASLILLLFAWLVVRRANAEKAAVNQLRHEVAQRTAAEERLRTGMRLEALGQITGGVAHDFNNLLMIIRGGADRLGKAELSGKLRRYVDAIGTAVDRGEKLTRQLLTFSRMQPVMPEVIDTCARLHGVNVALQSSLRGDIELRIECSPETWPVLVDAAQLELALINLAVNARDAMPDGGSFTLSAQNAVISSGPNGIGGEFVVIEARDTGRGIPHDVIARIFEPFFTTKEIGKGTGLGLSQVYGFATQSGGTVSVSSEMGKGTSVFLYLPRSADRPDAVAKGREDAPARVSRNMRVLLVEDNPDVAEVTQSHLDDLGFEVVHAVTARDALRHLQGVGQFDLVFSDIVMPGDMDGIELARSLRRDYPGLPVLLTTGYSDAIKAASDEGFRILHKPFRQEQLVAALEAILQRQGRS